MRHKTNIKSLKKFSLQSAWLAAILYCSWPLGYVFNRQVAGTGLASELEAHGQPYNWLFILLDVISGVFLLVATIVLWYAFASKRSRWLLAVLASYAAFGVFTIVDAALPMSCVPTLTQCPDLSHDYMLVAHGVASILAAVCLFISVLLVWWHSRHRHGAYNIIMSVMMCGWVLFGVASFVFFFIPGPGNLSQHYFITLCSVWVVLLPYILLTNPHPQQVRKRH